MDLFCAGGSRRAFFLFAILSLVAMGAWAQGGGVAARVTEAVNPKNVVTLKGNVHPLARAEYDRGAAPGNLKIDRMLLVLKRSDDQEATLRKLLDDQQDKNSRNYRAWLTPDQFGAQFGPADADVQKVTAWLASAGFQNVKVSRGRTVVEFSGNAAQVQAAFGTAIHKYVVNGKEHWANASDVSIPAGLAPVVAGVWTLHDFYSKTQVTVADEKFTATVRKHGVRPEFTSSTGKHALLPADYATIYNTPAKGNAYTAQSGSVAVVARTNINVTDVDAFHSFAQDNANTPVTILNGPDPGDLGGAEEAEAVLDSTWSGAAGPGANIYLVVSQSTAASDGADLSEAYIVDNNLADVMTESFSECEANATSARAAGILSLAQQAAAQGITYVVSSGDSGAAGCDNPSKEKTATRPNAVNVLASTPYTVSVGGTLFNDGGNNTYASWGSTNDPYTHGSALEHIAENAWNESCVAGATGCTNPGIWAGGGGPSALISKPSWQSGVAGIPADGKRDQPDVSLAAAAHTPYLICLDGSCVPNANGTIEFAGVSGTSAAAPGFAGFMTFVVRQEGIRVGQANYTLYKLAAAEKFGPCNGSAAGILFPASCVFFDVTQGNNAVPGEAGYGSASASYQTGVGYDLATGLGSVNVINMLNLWESASFQPTTTTLSVSPTTATHGDPLSVTAGVAPNSGTGIPTGSVWMLEAGNPYVSSITGNNTVHTLTLNAQGVFSGMVDDLPGGTYNLSGHYAGDSAYGGSDSAPVSLTIAPEPTTLDLSVLTMNTSGALVPFTTLPYGIPIYVQVQMHWASGAGTFNPYGFEDLSLYGMQDNVIVIMDKQGHFLGSTTALPGTYTNVGASFPGDQSFGASQATAAPFTITQAATTTSVTSQSVGAGTQFTVTVSAAGQAYAPTGSVTLMNGTNALATLQLPFTGSSSANRVQVSVTYDATALPAGQYSLIASYSGDQGYSASISAPTSVNLSSDFAVLPFGIDDLTVAAGQTAQYVNSVSLVGLHGFSGTVKLSCSLPASAVGTTCAVNPSSVTPAAVNATNGTNVSVKVTTTARTTSTGMLFQPEERPKGRLFGEYATSSDVTLKAFWVLVIFAILIISRRRRLAWSVTAAAILVTVTIGMAACGGGGGPASGGNGTTNPPPQNGTPAGSYVVTVTGQTGGTTHTLALKLTVN